VRDARARTIEPQNKTEAATQWGEGMKGSILLSWFDEGRNVGRRQFSTGTISYSPGLSRQKAPRRCSKQAAGATVASQSVVVPPQASTAAAKNATVIGLSVNPPKDMKARKSGRLALLFAYIHPDVVKETNSPTEQEFDEATAKKIH